MSTGKTVAVLLGGVCKVVFRACIEWFVGCSAFSQKLIWWDSTRLATLEGLTPWLLTQIHLARSPKMLYPFKKSSNRQNLRKKQRSGTQTHYERFEDKRLLATLPTSLPIATDLVTNGGFERATDGNEANFFVDSNVDGWIAADSSSGQRLNIFTFGDPATSDRLNVLELDSTASQFDSIYQDIQTLEGDTYILSFEFRERTVNGNATADTNQLELFWDGESLGIYSGVSHWQSVALVVTGADESTRLEFREVSTAASDGRGPLIDNVSLVSIADVEVINGGFELTTGDGQLIESSNVEGWNAVAADPANRLIAIETTDASEGDQFLALDTGSTFIDRVFQNIETTPGQSVYVSFDLRADGQTDADNQLRIRFDNQWVGTYTGTADWQRFGLLLDANSVEDFSRLVFRQAESATGELTGTNVDLDNVQVTVVDGFQPFAGLRALSEVPPEDRNGIYEEAPEFDIEADETFRATIELESGDEIGLLLYSDIAPVAVNNFVNLVEDGWYDNLFFNRVVNDGEGEPFVAQAGGPFTDSTAGGPGYTFENEIVEGINFDRPGLLAMANSGGTNTNGSQFFITYGTPTFLNGNFTIFGEIEADDLASFEVLDNLTFRDPATAEGQAIEPDVIDTITITID